MESNATSIVPNFRTFFNFLTKFRLITSCVFYEHKYFFNVTCQFRNRVKFEINQKCFLIKINQIGNRIENFLFNDLKFIKYII